MPGSNTHTTCPTMNVAADAADAVLAERRRLLEQDMVEGYQAMAEENAQMADEAILVDNETWPTP